METTSLYLLIALSLASVVVSILTFLKVKTINYLLEQPVVKKMSPQLKLKPVRIEDGEEEGRKSAPKSVNGFHGSSSGSASGPGGRGPRSEERGSDRGGRDFQRGDRSPRSDRSEGGSDRGERSDRNDRSPRGERERGDNRFRDRDRGRGDGRDMRHRGNRPEVFSNDREENASGPARSEAAGERTSFERPQGESSANTGFTPLSPRRPLPSQVAREEGEAKPFAAEPAPAPEMAGDALYPNEGEIQHGRRNQLKRKPRFDAVPEETEAAPEETKV